MNTVFHLPRPCLAIAIAAVLCVPSLAWGDEAKELFHDGIDAFERGDYKQAAEAFRKAYTAKESWKVLYNIGQAEAAVEISSTQTPTMRIDPTGTRVVLSGYSGGCFAWFEIGTDGEIPDSSALEYECSDWGSGQDVALRTSDVFYLTHSDSDVTVGEFISSGLLGHGVSTASGARNHALLIYDETVLITASMATGEITSFTIGSDETTLTLSDTESTGVTDVYQSTTTVSCPN
jgi:hypothetical protein